MGLYPCWALRRNLNCNCLERTVVLEPNHWSHRDCGNKVGAHLPRTAHAVPGKARRQSLTDCRSYLKDIVVVFHTSFVFGHPVYVLHRVTFFKGLRSRDLEIPSLQVVSTI